MLTPDLLGMLINASVPYLCQMCAKYSRVPPVDDFCIQHNTKLVGVRDFAVSCACVALANACL